MSGAHDRIIADAAKAALDSLGFRRKGRSRLWLADHGWWLRLVEFQPSAWSKGAYLNVGAHWLWSEMGHPSFDFGGRVDGFIAYLSDEQFAPGAVRLAESAADEAARLMQLFGSLPAATNILLNETSVTARLRGHTGWAAYHAGTAAGLAGLSEDAEEMFSRVLDSSAAPGTVLQIAAERMARLARDPLALRREVALMIAHQRDALRLPPLSAPPF
ncbi:MAG: hypothetical protein Q7J32_03100 [Sphingomonadaceae bacterium]|nr:hypothetical protein [Sphingomonadaceae bacterium]